MLSYLQRRLMAYRFRERSHVQTIHFHSLVFYSSEYDCTLVRRQPLGLTSRRVATHSAEYITDMAYHNIMLGGGYFKMCYEDEMKIRALLCLLSCE